jgi:hypothetical protein
MGNTSPSTYEKDIVLLVLEKQMSKQNEIIMKAIISGKEVKISSPILFKRKHKQLHQKMNKHSEKYALQS